MSSENRRVEQEGSYFGDMIFVQPGVLKTGQHRFRPENRLLTFEPTPFPRSKESWYEWVLF